MNVLNEHFDQQMAVQIVDYFMSTYIFEVKTFDKNLATKYKVSIMK